MLSIKRPLKKVIGRSTLDFDELHTVLVEVEGVINSRPITYVYDDQDSISYPLTPSDLIYGRRIAPTPNVSHQEIISTYQALTRRSLHHKKLLQQLTDQWKKEYLTSLLERKQHGAKGGDKEYVSLGDIVILKNDATSRSYWRLAKVEELIYGADGNRAAIVKLSNNRGSPVHLRRVIQHLVPIEVRAPSQERTIQEVSRPLIRANDNQRPLRNAAIIGEIRRRSNATM